MASLLASLLAVAMAVACAVETGLAESAVLLTLPIPSAVRAAGGLVKVTTLMEIPVSVPPVMFTALAACEDMVPNE